MIPTLLQIQNAGFQDMSALVIKRNEIVELKKFLKGLRAQLLVKQSNSKLEKKTGSFSILINGFFSDFSKYVEDADATSSSSTVDPSPRGKSAQHQPKKGQQKRKNKRR